MNGPFAVSPSYRRLPLAFGWVIASFAASWPLAALAGDYIDVEPEVSAHGQAHPRPPPAAAVNAPGTQLLPGAVPPWQRSTAAAHTPPSTVAAAPSPAKMIPAQGTKTAPPQSGSTEPTRMAAVSEGAGDAALAQTPLAVTRWSLNGTVEQQPDGALTITAAAGRPLYLKFTIDGGEAAIDRLRADGRLAIEVHWARAGDVATSGAPELTTELTIGRPELAGFFASQVQKQGHFEWHMWARKDALSPGQWTVSLTYPDGSPVQCGEAQPHPCRLAVNAS